MATPVLTALTMGEVVAELIRRGGALFGYATEGIASSGTTTLVDTTKGASGLGQFTTNNDPGVYQKMQYIFKGTHAGQVMFITAFTTATSTITIATITGAIDTTDNYLIFSPNVFTIPQITRAVRAAFASLTYDKATSTGVMLNVAEGREIMLGNALLNPVFDLYTTANAPDSWTTTNMTATQETTITYGGARRSLKCITDGANVANLTQSLTEIGRYKGQSVSLWAWVYCTTANEMFLRFTDGVTTTNSSLHTGTGWEKLSISPTVGANASAATVSVRSTTAASTITFYTQVVQFPKVPADEHVYALDADIGIIAINPTLRVSDQFSDVGGGVGNFKREITGDKWSIVMEATRKIRLDIDSSYNGCVLEYKGWKAHPELTAATTTFNATLGQVDALIMLAMEMLFVAVVGQPAAGDVATMRASLLKQFGTTIPASAKRIELI